MFEDKVIQVMEQAVVLPQWTPDSNLLKEVSGSSTQSQSQSPPLIQSSNASSFSGAMPLPFSSRMNSGDGILGPPPFPILTPNEGLAAAQIQIPPAEHPKETPAGSTFELIFDYLQVDLHIKFVFLNKNFDFFFISFWTSHIIRMHIMYQSMSPNSHLILTRRF